MKQRKQSLESWNNTRYLREREREKAAKSYLIRWVKKQKEKRNVKKKPKRKKQSAALRFCVNSRWTIFIVKGRGKKWSALQPLWAPSSFCLILKFLSFPPFSILISGIMIYLGNKKFPFVAVCKIIFMTAKSKRYVIPFVLFIVFFAIRYNIENACYVEFWHIEQSIYIDCNFWICFLFAWLVFSSYQNNKHILMGHDLSFLRGKSNILLCFCINSWS